MPRRNNRPSHQPFHFASSCASKRRFGAEKQALDAADYQSLVQPNLQLSVYKCELCGGWHLTRRQIRDE